MKTNQPDSHKDITEYLQKRTRDVINRDIHLQDTITVEAVKTYNPFNDNDKATRDCMAWLYDECLGNAKSMIDLGCGNGLPTMAMALHLDIFVTAIDGSRLWIEFAKALRDKCGLYKITFFERLIDDTILPDKHADVAFSKHTLEHLTCPEKALHEMKRIANVTCGFVPNEHSIIASEHLWYWTKKELHVLLLEVFDNVEVKRFGNLLGFVGK